MITIEQKRKGMKHAILSTCWGVPAQMLVKESSVFILFAISIGAGEMLSIFTTSVMDLMLCLTMLPFAYLAEKTGNRETAVLSTATAMAGMLVCAAAPWFGGAAKSIMLLGLLLYATSLSAYTSAWFPLLNGIVPENERGRFFGKLRVSWQSTSAVFLLLSGLFVGKTASTGKLQLIVAVAAILTIGRMWHLSRIPQEKTRRSSPFINMLTDAIGNGPLVAFGLYLFLLYASASSTLPVAFLMAKKHLLLQDNIVVLLSAVAFVGTITGFFAGGLFVDKAGVKPVFLAAHFGFAAINLAMLFVNKIPAFSIPIMSALLLVQGFLTASASIAVSTEMLALAPANNKSVSIAVCFSLYSAGIAFSRMLSSFVLGSGMLAESWTLFGRNMTHYDTMFLAYGIAVIMSCSALVLVPALTRGAKRLPSV